MKALISSEIVLKRLSQSGFELPAVSVPGGNYVSVNIRNNIAYMAIQFPIINGSYYYLGKLGEELSTNDGYKAIQLCGLNVLSQIHHKIGFDKLLGLNHIDAYYQAADDWDGASEVVNGASDLFVNILDEAGQHSRSLIGVQKLPRNFSVGLTVSLTLL